MKMMNFLKNYCSISSYKDKTKIKLSLIFTYILKISIKTIKRYLKLPKHSRKYFNKTMEI